MHKTTFTEKEIELHDRIYAAVVAKAAEVDLRPTDMAILALRLYVIVCDQLETKIPEILFVHNKDQIRLSYCLSESEPSPDAPTTPADNEKQMSVADVIFDITEALDHDPGIWQLLPISGRLFMTAFDKLDPRTTSLSFVSSHIRYNMNILNELDKKLDKTTIE